MITRSLLLFVAFGLMTHASAQTAAPAAKKAAEPTSETAAPKADEDATIITPFRPAQLPVAKETHTFQLAKLNKLQATETTRELQRLYSAYANQNIIDGSPAGFSKALGYITTITYAVHQDLGDNRYFVKASWPAVGSIKDGLPAAADAYCILLLDHPVAVGSSGKANGMHVGMVALQFTAKFPPLDGKRLTMRRDAFVECTPLEDSPAALQKFATEILQGSNYSVTTLEKITCKTCGGLGFTREAQKGKLEDKRTPCAECEGGKTAITVETKFIP
jgi:hypothetical protein